MASLNYATVASGPPASELDGPGRTRKHVKRLAFSGMGKENHQAILASKPLGQVRTQYFLDSSRTSKPIPKAAGRNQCSTETVLVSIVSWRAGM